MLMEDGLSVVHLFGKPRKNVDRKAVAAAVEQAEADDCQVITASILGHKADFCFMTLCADWRTQRTLQTSLRNAGIDIVDSYVSITEVSEYAKGMPVEMLRGRLHPVIPPADLDGFCFYPMSKKREAHANWYSTPYERRQDMMMEHGKSGRAFAGQVAQVISGSTGLDDFEWGVTLFAKSPDVIKEVVYTMRFDEGSALYGEFGTFYVGYLDTIENFV